MSNPPAPSSPARPAGPGPAATAAVPVSSRFNGIPAVPLAGHEGAPRLQVAGDSARLILDRPAQHNRLDPADVDALGLWFTRIEAEGALRSLVITGRGERTFSSGYTLQAITTELDDRFEAMLNRLERLPLTTIAAINGGLYGGATDLALCCDLRLGVQGTRMFMPAVRFGLHYYPDGLRRYVSRLGLTAAQKILLTAVTIEQDEMLRIGFLTDLVARNELDVAVERYLRALDETDRGTVAAVKASLHHLSRPTVDLAPLEAACRASLQSEVLRERLARLLGHNPSS